MHDQPAAAGHHHAAVGMALLDEPPRQRAEGRLALPGEDLRHHPAFLALNLVVAVHRLEAEPHRDRASDGRLARAHEAHKVEIDGRLRHAASEAAAPVQCKTSVARAYDPKKA